MFFKILLYNDYLLEPKVEIILSFWNLANFGYIYVTKIIHCWCCWAILFFAKWQKFATIKSTGLDPRPLPWCLEPSKKPANMGQLLVPRGFKHCMCTEFSLHSGQANCLLRFCHKCPFALAGCVWCCPYTLWVLLWFYACYGHLVPITGSKPA
jgi:hypothetical protein